MSSVQRENEENVKKQKKSKPFHVDKVKYLRTQTKDWSRGEEDKRPPFLLAKNRLSSSHHYFVMDPSLTRTLYVITAAADRISPLYTADGYDGGKK